MAEEPDRLRQDIENTRASLTRDVDLLAEKTSPTKVAQRRWATFVGLVFSASMSTSRVSEARVASMSCLNRSGSSAIARPP